MVERMRFGPFLVFAALWSVLVYGVLAHWAFGGGWLQAQGTLDFAGGIPVEMGSGFSALAAALVVGARRDYGRQAFLPHNSMFVLLGAGLLWFGWFGFNGGSGFGAGNAGVLAFVNTLLTPACALATWFVLDLLRSRQVTAIGAATAIVVGCVGITPAAGFISPLWAMVLGVVAALPSYAVIMLRPRSARRRDARRARRPRRRRPDRDPLHRARRPDVLERRRRRRVLRRPGAARRASRGRARRARLRVRRDVRAAEADRARHAAAGDARARRRCGMDLVAHGRFAQLGEQFVAVLAAPADAFAATFVLLKLIGLVMPLRATAREEALGMDLVAHGEEAYATGEGAVLVDLPEPKPRRERELVEA